MYNDYIKFLPRDIQLEHIELQRLHNIEKAKFRKLVKSGHILPTDRFEWKYFLFLEKRPKQQYEVVKDCTLDFKLYGSYSVSLFVRRGVKCKPIEDCIMPIGHCEIVFEDEEDSWEN